MIGSFALKPNQGDMWCFYIVRRTTDAEVVFHGAARLAEVPNMTLMAMHPLCDLNATYICEIISIHEKDFQAKVARNAYMGGKFGAFDTYSTQQLHSDAGIICEQTGELFKNASEAARLLELSNSQLSNHLARKPSHRAVKGYTFRYASYFDASISGSRFIVTPSPYSGVQHLVQVINGHHLHFYKGRIVFRADSTGKPQPLTAADISTEWTDKSIADAVKAGIFREPST